MFGLFYKIRTGKKGQLAALLTVLLVAFLIFAFLTVNLGTIGLQRTRLSNAADSAALAAGSVASQLLNYMAGYNELMVINFSGFITTTMCLLIQMVLDIIALLACIKEGGWKLLSCIGSLVLDIATLGIVIGGATKVGKALEKRIRELNDRLPKNTRNIARQYAFQNAGIDEPKIAYNDWLKKTGRSDSDSAWKEYLKLETSFEAFMRTLADTNEANTDNTLSFNWTDQRQGQIVNNVVEVYTTPMQPLYLETKDFADVALDSSLRREIKDVIAKVGLRSSVRRLTLAALFLAPLILVLIEIIAVNLMWIIMALLIILIVIFKILVAVYKVCCKVGIRKCCEKEEDARRKLETFEEAKRNLRSATVSRPHRIPCLVYGKAYNDLTVSVVIRRRTERAAGGAFLDYGLWRMQYPVVSSYSRVGVEGTGGGRLFPPVTDYDPKIIQTR